MRSHQVDLKKEVVVEDTAVVEAVGEEEVMVVAIDHEILIEEEVMGEFHSNISRNFVSRTNSIVPIYTGFIFLCFLFVSLILYIL